MEFTDYWKTLRRRWRTVVLALAVVLGISACITWQATPMYSSSARLFVATTEADASQLYQGGMFATQRVESYADIVPKSRKLADQVVDDLGGGVTPGHVMSEVRASVVPNTVNLVITVVDPDPVRARDIAQAYAESLSTLVSTLETPDGATNPLIRAEIVDNASVSTTPVLPRPVRNLGFGFVLGLLLGLGLAVVRELLDNSVTSAGAIGEITPAPILGRIISDSSAVRLPPTEALGGTSHWAEAFRVMRTNLQYVDVDSPQKTFVVSSSLPEEGKSTTAVHLAVTIALTKQRVALVECDLRRPLIARRLGLDGAVGTTNVLIGTVPLRDAMQPYQDTGLDVLACGPIPPNPAELLQSRAMANLLQQLRAEYDVVLLDAPPLLPVTDAAVLAAQTDGALVVVRHGKTTRDQLNHAVERLTAVDARVLGVTLNMLPARRRGDGRYSYNYGYYSYGYSSNKSAPSLTSEESAPQSDAPADVEATGGAHAAQDDAAPVARS